MLLNISHMEKLGHNLGPDGEAFAAIWFHACDRSCPQCIAASWNLGEPKYQLPERVLAEMMCADVRPDGFVLSGGEPFLQAEGIRCLMERIDGMYRPSKPGLMVYTGYRYEELCEIAESRAAVGWLLSRIDVLVDGPYDPQQDDDRNRYMGSTNQRMLFLSDRYSPADFTRIGREVKLVETGSEVLMSGIPDRAAKAVWDSIRRSVMHPDQES